MINPKSGHDDKDQVRSLVAAALESADQCYEFVNLENPSEISRLAKDSAERVKREGGALVVVGGDGSLNAFAAEALRVQCPFGVIPQGTFNYFARTQGIPENPTEATLSLLNGRLRSIPVGLLNGDVFLVNASIGLYPELLEDREELKQRFGRSRLVALWAALGTMLREHRQLTLELEHEGRVQRKRTPTLVVANNKLQLLDVGLDAKALEAGALTAVTLGRASFLGLLKLAVRAAIGDLGTEPAVETFSFRQLSVEPGRSYGGRRLKTALDGEVRFHRAPLRFEVAPQRLQLLTALAPVQNDRVEA